MSDAVLNIGTAHVAPSLISESLARTPASPKKIVNSATFQQSTAIVGIISGIAIDALGIGIILFTPNPSIGYVLVAVGTICIVTSSINLYHVRKMRYLQDNQQQLDQFRNENETFKNQTIIQKEQIDLLETNLQTQAVQLDNQKEINKNLTDQNTIFSQNNEIQKKQNEELSEVLEKNRLQIESQVLAINKLTQENESFSQNNEILKTQNSEFQIKISDLENNNRNYQTLNGELETKLQSLQTIVVQLKDENTLFQTNNSHLKDQVAEIEEQNKKSQELINELNANNVQYESINQEISKKIKELKNENKNFRESVDTLNFRKKELEKDLESLHQQRQDLEKQVRFLEETNAIQKQNLESFRATDLKLSNTEKKLAETEKKLKVSALEAKKANELAIQAINNMTHKSNEAYDSIINTAEMQLNILTNTATNLNLKNKEESEAFLKELEQKIESFRDVYRQIQLDNKEFQTTLDQLSGISKNLEEDRQAIHETNKHLEEKISKLNTVANQLLFKKSEEFTEAVIAMHQHSPGITKRIKDIGRFNSLDQLLEFGTGTSSSASPSPSHSPSPSGSRRASVNLEKSPTSRRGSIQIPQLPPQRRGSLNLPTIKVQQEESARRGSLSVPSTPKVVRMKEETENQ